MVKKILLVNPWVYDFAAYDLWMFPLGLLNIASYYFKKEKIKIEFLNCLDRFDLALTTKKQLAVNNERFGADIFINVRWKDRKRLKKYLENFFVTD